MREIAIYVEGGGETAQQKAELRNGFDQLLNAQKQAARVKRLRWKLVPCGGRDATYKYFVQAIRHADGDTLCVLLVDSEEGLPPELPVADVETKDQKMQRQRTDAGVRRDHVVGRDGWDLKNVRPECIHLMVQCMEAWIVADPDGMAIVYAKNFHPAHLPVRFNLEDEPKASLYAKFAKATKDTAKGEYSEANHSKIKHASKLLETIHPDRVAARCPRFATFTQWLSEKIAET